MILVIHHTLRTKGIVGHLAGKQFYSRENFTAGITVSNRENGLSIQDLSFEKTTQSTKHAS